MNTLPFDMLEELNKFLSFLKYNNSKGESSANSLNDYMKTTQFQKDRERLHATYENVLNGKATKTRFDLIASKGNRARGLKLLDKLDGK